MDGDRLVKERKANPVKMIRSRRATVKYLYEPNKRQRVLPTVIQ